MKRIILMFIFFIPLFLATCKKSSLDSVSNAYSVSGYVYENGKPVVNAQISIDSIINYKTTTDENGYFQILPVSEGLHTLTVDKEYSSGVFVKSSNKIDVNDDIEIDSLTLPNPVRIESSKIAGNTVNLYWGQSKAKDFREYKLYQHSTTGLDETTGTLLHVTTDRIDTTFEFSLPAMPQSYYRVFVLNEYGKLGGSNVFEIALSNFETFPDGGFELSNTMDYLESWDGQSVTGLSIDSEIYFEGKQSLNIQTESTIDLYHKYIYIKPETKYEFSCMYKAKGTRHHEEYPLIIGVFNQDQESISYYTVFDESGEIDIDWSYTSTVFTTKSTDSKIRIYIYSCVDNIWLDNLTLRRK